MGDHLREVPIAVLLAHPLQRTCCRAVVRQISYEALAGLRVADRPVAPIVPLIEAILEDIQDGEG